MGMETVGQAGSNVLLFVPFRDGGVGGVSKGADGEIRMRTAGPGLRNGRIGGRFVGVVVTVRSDCYFSAAGRSIASVVFRQQFGTVTWRFGPCGRVVMAGFYPMTTIVGCGRAGQVPVLDGWTLAIGGGVCGGGGPICTYTDGFFGQIKST